MLTRLVLLKYNNNYKNTGSTVMVKTCDSNIARRNTKAPLDLFEFDIEETGPVVVYMAQRRNGDRIPKAMKTILPAKIIT